MRLYTIGEMAKIANISVRTLRYYDEMGIIVPEARDENTNYRYYSNTQMLQLQILKELRALDFSLDEIKNIIHNEDTNHINHIQSLKSKFEKKLDYIQKEINNLKLKTQAIHNAYNRLTNGLDILSIPDKGESQLHINKTYENEIYRLPQIWTLSIRKYSTLNVNQLFLNRCMELQRLLDRYDLYQAGGFIGIFHDGFQSQFSDVYGDLELCLPFIKPSNFECDEQKMFGGFLVASTIHIGHYKNAYDKYLSLSEWISEIGYTIVGPPIEFYILEPFHSINSDSYITKLCFPISNNPNSEPNLFGQSPTNIEK